MTVSYGTRTRLPILVSVTAGNGGGAAREAALQAALAAAFDPDFLYPRTLDELAAMARAEAAAAALVVAGGDGTIHRVLNALRDPRPPLGVIPIGSGNDFCRGLGLPLDPVRAAASIATGRRRAIDLLEVNGHAVATVAGLGVVSTIGLAAGRALAPGSRWRPLLRPLGPVPYLVTAMTTLLLSPRPTRYARVRWRRGAADEWQEFEGPLHGVFLALLPTLGAGLRLPVPSRPDDGRMELCVLPKNPRLRLVRALASLRGGRKLPNGTLIVEPVAETEIEWEGGTAVMGDGEDLGSATRIEARIRPGALTVLG